MGLTLVDGIREIRSALKASVEIAECFLCPQLIRNAEGKDLLRLLKQQDFSISEVTPEIFAKISFGDRQEGILVVAQIPPSNLDSLPLQAEPLLIVVEHLEKPGNLGAILRTADTAGVGAVLVCDPATDIFNPNVIRASLGAVFAVPCAVCSNQEAWNFLKKRGIRILASTPAATTLYTQVRMTRPVAIVLGSEESGLSSFWEKLADEKIKIPMAGQVNSLNVSAAAAILVYEALRQRIAGSG